MTEMVDIEAPLKNQAPENVGSPYTTPIQCLMFCGCLVACLSAGFLGSIATSSSVKTWYTTIKKPTWNPPNWIFAPVWTTLYIMMAISLFLVMRGGVQKRRVALVVFGIQLVLNLAWSIIFFGLHSLWGAAVEIVFLWISIATTMALFLPISKVAFGLLVPYILWVSFASILNFTIASLNSGSTGKAV